MSYNFSFSESVQGSTMFQSSVTMATISDRRVLTSFDAQKTTLELELSWQIMTLNSRDDIESDSKSSLLSYEPGDALCFICPNDSLEVDYLLKRSAITKQCLLSHTLSLFFSLPPSHQYIIG